MKKNKYYDLLYEEGLKDEPEEEIPEENLLPFDEKESENSVWKTVHGIGAGIVLFTALELILAALFAYGWPMDWNLRKAKALFGILIGGGYAVFWLLSIRWQTESLLMPDVKNPKWKLKLGVVARIVLLAGILALGGFFGLYDPIFVVAGSLNLKLGALTFPFFAKKKNKTE